MFGITPMPIYDPKQEVSYLRDFMIFFKPGDIVKFKPVDHHGYDAAVEAVNAGKFDPPIKAVDFSLDEFHANPTATSDKLVGLFMALEILKPGLSTTVQDRGRPGYYHLGIPKSGAMDRYALGGGQSAGRQPRGSCRARGGFPGSRDSFRTHRYRRGLWGRHASES